MIGQSISHYHILEKLGEGGMGIVYKARDTKLDRTVALKFLPDRVNKDEPAKARFLQEAQAAAGLNHPNICTVYGVDEHEGQLFMSMEYVEGGTLRERLPYPKVNDALNIAVQIGEALQEAHAKGIVHRDIKADNIMLTAKDQAKVMDFGLAKLKGALKLTRTSSTVGTLGYMAPEQIQGGEVDHRSDIFSFGVLLFEMLTGKLPFRGEHEAAMVYSIVNAEPVSLTTYVSDAQPELIRILGRSLEKDPEDRYQSAADMVSELRHVLKQSSRVQRSSPHVPVVASRSEQTISSVPRPSFSPKNIWIIGGGAGILVLGALLYGFFFAGGGSSGERASLNPEMTLRVLPIPFSEFSYPGISKDGNWIAFPAANANTKWDIYYMHASANESRRITTDSIDTGWNLNADISPDGSLIVYQRPRTDIVDLPVDICVISSIGGQSKRLVQQASLPRWRPDGQRIGYVRFSTRTQRSTYNLWSMRSDGTDNRLEFADTLGNAYRASRYSYNWSPDGRSVAWIRSFEGGYQEVITRELSSGEERQLTFDKKNIDDVAWTKNGNIIFSSNRGGNTNLWVVPIDGGTPTQLTKGGGPDIGLSVSLDDQKLVYLQQQQLGTVWIANLRSASTQQLTFDDRNVQSLAISPDGQKIAYTMSEIDPLKPGVSLYLQNRNGSDRRLLLSATAGVSSLEWSPDGANISYAMVGLEDPADSARIFVIDAGDPSDPRVLTPGTGATWITPQTLVVSRVRASVESLNSYTSYAEVVGLNETLPHRRLDDSITVLRAIQGNRILILDRHAARSGLWTVSSEYLVDVSKAAPKKVVLPDGGLLIPGRRSLYVLDKKDRLMKVDYLTGSKQRVRGSLSGLSFASSVLASRLISVTNQDVQIASTIGVNDDDSELTFVALRFSAKLVMIENIFK
ncbi:MAG: hypothetical protein A3C56_01535 [Ignavibacteria bacterium RIFCSPHIGHO2_02_FULL_56_12]|nr:MAG: hypothetical protein A3C56_01535 [Ignavibacteria bacterium RIFCSPHIGHO2_02_FULL_56_12]